MMIFHTTVPANPERLNKHALPSDFCRSLSCNMFYPLVAGTNLSIRPLPGNVALVNRHPDDSLDQTCIENVSLCS